MVFNESVGKRSKLFEVEVEKARSRRGDGCNTFLLTEIGMNACSEQRPRLDPSRTRAEVFVFLVYQKKAKLSSLCGFCPFVRLVTELKDILGLEIVLL